MYLLSSDERQLIGRGLRVAAREQPVAEELRGWRWPVPPLRPIYDVAMALGAVGWRSGATEEGTAGLWRAGLGVGANGSCERDRLHAAAAATVVAVKRLVYVHGNECLARLADLGWGEAGGCGPARGAAVGDAGVEWRVGLMRQLVLDQLVERLREVLSLQRSLSPDALVALAVPVVVDLVLDGRPLGLERRVLIEAVDLSEQIVLGLCSGVPTLTDRLVLAAMALVLERRFEVPFDVGCLVSLEFVGDRPVGEREVFLIGDELRLMFVEERDEWARRAAQAGEQGLSSHGAFGLDRGLPIESRTDLVADRV